MDKIELIVLGLSYSQTQSGAYSLILADKSSKHRIPIIIGSYEAQAIAIELENLKPPRPLTHDLFVKFAESVDAVLQEAIIFKLHEGVFYSKLVFQVNDKTIEIDARTSDAIALALRFRCKIYTSQEIIDKAGIILKDDLSKSEIPPSSEKRQVATPKKEGLSSLSKSELETLLAKCIKDEDYEQASKINKELQNRN